MNSFLNYEILERLAFYLQISELNGNMPTMVVFPGF